MDFAGVRRAEARVWPTSVVMEEVGRCGGNAGLSRDPVLAWTLTP